jgi:hypothetical protein
MLLTTLEYDYICLVCSWLHWRTDTVVLYVTDYTGVRIHLSCMLLTTLEYDYVCHVCYWLHWSTDTFVLYVTDYTGVRIHMSCMLLTTLEYGYICLLCYWLHGVRIHLSCMLLTTLEYGYICLLCYWLHWSTHIFVLYVPDYTGVWRVVRNSTRQIYQYSSVVSNIQDKCIRTSV